jgi:hypothetical protein
MEMPAMHANAATGTSSAGSSFFTFPTATPTGKHREPN